MCCAYSKIFRLADERMNGTGGGGARDAERGKETSVRDAERGKETSARDAEHKWARVWCRTRPAPETSQGGGWPRTGRGVSATRQSLCGATSITLEWSFTAFTRLACKCAVLMLN